MLIEKEIIRPGTYWYTDQETNLPRKLDVTPELCKYWHEQGSKMLGTGLTIPVPCEHDFSAHPMTPADKLKNNAGWVKEYRLKEDGRLFGVVDVQDEELAKKLPHTIRWTSPWINSFTDGNGQRWNNVITHLALTTRPRITKQAPFGSVAAALSMASEVKVDPASVSSIAEAGFCLSRAGLLGIRKKSKRLCPRYPIAFSLYSGITLSDDDIPPRRKGGGMNGGGDGDMDDDDGFEGDDFDSNSDDQGGGDNKGKDGTGGGGGTDSMIDLPPYNDPRGDVSMEELLCDLLGALGIYCEKSGNEQQFKRSLYTAAMMKINELTQKAQNPDKPAPGNISNQQKPNQPTGAQPNPLVQQEQQPMYMSLEEINKLPEPMRGVALAMYTENQKLRAEMEAAGKVANSLRDAKLKEASTQRAARVALLGKLSPRAKADLDAMLALPSMALSMGDDGTIVDPMEQTLAVLEKGLADMPRLLTTETSALSVQAQPTDAEMSQEAIETMADNMARMMGCPPEKKAS